MNTQTSLHSQRGSALILALLIAGVVAALAVEMGTTFDLVARRAENQSRQSRAAQFLLGAESLAVQVLSSDALESEVDHLGELWASPLPPLDIPQGWLSLRIADDQGRFNVNNLLAKTPYFEDLSAPPQLRFSPSQKQFIRLLQSLEQHPVSEANAIAITEALVDWIDPDDRVSGTGGAESLFYAAEQPRYDAGNRLLSDLSELRLVRHFSDELLGAIRPLIVALPHPTGLNLNTAPASVLRAVNASGSLQPLSTDKAELIVQHRANQAFYQPAELAAVAGLDLPIVELDLANPAIPTGPDYDFLFAGPPSDSEAQQYVQVFAVESQYFTAFIQAQSGTRTDRATARLSRDETGARVRSRQRQ